MHSPAAIDGQRPGTRQLPRLAARFAPAALGLPLQRELLHALVAVFDHIEVRNAAAGREGDIIRKRKLSRAGPLLAPDADELTLGGEDLHTMVAGVRDVEQAVRAERHGADARELPRLGT